MKELIIYLFDGFYNSFSSDILERFYDNTGEDPKNDDCIKLAKGFVRSLSSLLLIDIEFSRLVIPKKYNFETDKIYAKVDEGVLKKIWRDVRKNHKEESNFEDVLTEQLTPHDGFIPFYSCDPLDWLVKNFEEFDACELGIVFLAYCRMHDVELDDILEDSTYYEALE